jgi:hypothetical protein
MTEGWGVVACVEMLASAGVAVSVTVAATAVATASTAFDIVIFIKAGFPYLELIARASKRRQRKRGGLRGRGERHRRGSTREGRRADKDGGHLERSPNLFLCGLGCGAEDPCRQAILVNRPSGAVMPLIQASNRVG